MNFNQITNQYNAENKYKHKRKNDIDKIQKETYYEIKGR